MKGSFKDCLWMWSMCHLYTLPFLFSEYFCKDFLKNVHNYDNPVGELFLFHVCVCVCVCVCVHTSSSTQHFSCYLHLICRSILVQNLLQQIFIKGLEANITRLAFEDVTLSLPKSLCCWYILFPYTGTSNCCCENFTPYNIKKVKIPAGYLIATGKYLLWQGCHFLYRG